jgi:hypothetical protein
VIVRFLRRALLIWTTVWLTGQADAQFGSANALSAEEQAEGWKLLFDGTAVTGFRGLQKPDFLKAGWSIVRGELFLAKDFKDMGKVTGGDLVSTEQFEDFEFSFEWKLSVSANTGVRYLARRGAGGAAMGMEYQIIDDVHHHEGLKGGPIRRTGALDGVLPPVENKRLKDPGEWNRGRLIVQGAHVEHWLNGQKVVEFDLGSRALAAAVQAAKPKLPPGFGMTKFKSPIVLVDQGDEVSFRALKIRALPATPPPSATPANATPAGRATPLATPAAPGRPPATPAGRTPAGIPPTAPDLR